MQARLLAGLKRLVCACDKFRKLATKFLVKNKFGYSYK